MTASDNKAEAVIFFIFCPFLSDESQMEANCQQKKPPEILHDKQPEGG